MSQLILQEDLANRILEQARQRGYANPEAYLLDLLEADVEEWDESQVALNDDLGLGFKDAFKDAIRGKFFTKDEYRRMMADDE